METKLTGENKRLIIIAFAAGIAVTVAIAALLTNIFERRLQGGRFPGMVLRVSDDDVNPEKWGENFPSEFEDHLAMRDEDTPTPFGGSMAYSKLIRFPQLTRLWGGYPFAADFNEERTHFYSQIDQRETKRNDRAWLNARGFPKFKGQPGACMNCHSGWTPKYIRLMGWEGFNKTPYMEIIARMDRELGKTGFGSELGSTCADCHSPSDMSLRVTRPAYINAMKARGYRGDPVHGIEAPRAEMRRHVCQQCHVEYYFKKETTELTFPWGQWPKDEPLHIEMIEAYYNTVRGAFSGDWTHRESGASMIKMQHPETELFSSGIHARSGVACPDCHMPYRRSGGVKVTNHNVLSPLRRPEEACRTCHPLEEQAIIDRVLFIQLKTAAMLRTSEKSILALVDDINGARALLAANPSFIAGKSAGHAAAAIDAVLKEPQEFHRRAQMRWDFIFSENSTGFHSPQEAARVLAQSIDLARQGQLSLVKALAGAGIAFTPTVGYGRVPAPGGPIAGRMKGMGDTPPAGITEYDRLEK
jgi:nitrite reductase (cytochrome c-552)